MSVFLLLKASGPKGGTIRLQAVISLSWLSWFWGKWSAWRSHKAVLRDGLIHLQIYNVSTAHKRLLTESPVRREHIMDHRTTPLALCWALFPGTSLWGRRTLKGDPTRSSRSSRRVDNPFGRSMIRVRNVDEEAPNRFECYALQEKEVEISRGH